MPVRNGVRHHNAKFNDALVLKVRKLYDDGMSLTQLEGWLYERGYDISLGTIRYVTSRRGWKHVPEQSVPRKDPRYRVVRSQR